MNNPIRNLDFGESTIVSDRSEPRHFRLFGGEPAAVGS